MIVYRKDLANNVMMRGAKIIDLSGEDGNAYVLMAYARQFAEQMRMTEQEIEKMLKEMKSDDYENLLQVFDHYFFSVILVRSDRHRPDDSDDDAIPAY